MYIRIVGYNDISYYIGEVWVIIMTEHLSVVWYRADLYYFQMLGYTFLEWIMVYMRKYQCSYTGP